MVWRATPQEAKSTDGASRKAALRGRVEGGVPVGLLGYVDGEPTAWCSVAPRETYRRLGGPDGDGVWSVVCFFVPRRARGGGLMTAMLHAAIEHARQHGARVLEAYPVDPDSPSYRFMGFVPAYEALGFHEVTGTGKRRHVMRLNLTP
ncbi:MAG: GNAT family N-acetyltransferase [Actinoallomurus sp.]